MADRETKLFMGVLYVPAAVWLFFFFLMSWEFDCFHEVEQLPENLFFLFDTNLFWADTWRVFKWW